jgi:hypothetical protein
MNRKKFKRMVSRMANYWHTRYFSEWKDDYCYEQCPDLMHYTKREVQNNSILFDAWEVMEHISKWDCDDVGYTIEHLVNNMAAQLVPGRTSLIKLRKFLGMQFEYEGNRYRSSRPLYKATIKADSDELSRKVPVYLSSPAELDFTALLKTVYVESIRIEPLGKRSLSLRSRIDLIKRLRIESNHSSAKMRFKRVRGIKTATGPLILEFKGVKE